jgi:hypothetical protein
MLGEGLLVTGPYWKTSEDIPKSTVGFASLFHDGEVKLWVGLGTSIKHLVRSPASALA